MVQVDFQSLHYVLVLKFLEFGPELFLVFVHLWVHIVYLPLFEHQQETRVENRSFWWISNRVKLFKNHFSPRFKIVHIIIF